MVARIYPLYNEQCKREKLYVTFYKCNQSEFYIVADVYVLVKSNKPWLVGLGMCAPGYQHDTACTMLIYIHTHTHERTCICILLYFARRMWNRISCRVHWIHQRFSYRVCVMNEIWQRLCLFWRVCVWLILFVVVWCRALFFFVIHSINKRVSTNQPIYVFKYNLPFLSFANTKISWLAACVLALFTVGLTYFHLLSNSIPMCTFILTLFH